MRISVVTAVYNGAATLPSAMESLVAQREAEYESVIVDGASTDSTMSVLNRFLGPRFVVISEPDHGIYDALNKGVRLATGDAIGFLHADDEFAQPHVLARVASVLDETGADAVYGDLVYVARSDPSRVIRYWKAGQFDRQSLKYGWMPPHPTFYARRSAYERLGAFDTHYRISADYDCMMRMLLSDHFKVAYLPEVMVRMRLGGASNKSFKAMIRKSREDYMIVKRHGLGGVHTLLSKNLRKVGQFVTGGGDR